MKRILTLLYRIYQLLIACPLLVVSTIITALVTVTGCSVGNGNFWGYHPGKWWGRVVLAIFLLPVQVSGREKLQKGQSYVFVANHQGAFDIFLVYGYLGRNFKWMMKRALRKMPFVGIACEYAHHIFVDKSSPSRIKQTYDKAREILKDEMSLMVFPEGARTFTGHMGVFRRGAFMLADELQLPVVPITINGSFDIMPRMRDGKWVAWSPVSLQIHEPIPPIGKGNDNVQHALKTSYDAIMSGIVPKYQGFVENPDQ